LALIYCWLPRYLYERFQRSLAGAGFSATFYIQAVAFAGILGGGLLADRWSSKNPRARVLVPVAGFVAGGLFLFVVGWTSSPWVLSVCLVVSGLSRGFLDCNARPILCQIAPTKLRATGYGLFNLAGCIAGGTRAALAGALTSAIGLGGALQFSAALLLLAAFVLSCVQPRAQLRTLSASAVTSQ
jgi:MFS transporter, Spinster family, sphingosine-1-phosphate transporter